MIQADTLGRVASQKGCCICGTAKPPGHYFCTGCEGELPDHMRRAASPHEKPVNRLAVQQAANYLREKKRSYSEVRPRHLRLKHEKRGKSE